jgi:purine-nucleoside phosphorylase
VESGKRIHQIREKILTAVPGTTVEERRFSTGKVARNNRALALDTTMTDQFTLAETAAQSVLQRSPLRPRIGLVLGSGLGSFADSLTDSTKIPFAEIPAFPSSTAIGHAGQMVIGKAGTVPVAVMQGRVHLYEGYSPQQVAFPVRVFGRMGIRAVILTNAAGGINLTYKQGALVVLSDHINLQGTNPLVGPNDDRLGLRFPDMTHAYDKSYRAIARDEARKLDIPLQEGVYAALLGPSYETPAEIRYLRTIGADLVGMSTAFEVVAARHVGIKVLAISCVTNMAAGILDQPLSHEEVMETGERVRTSFEALLRAVLPRIEKDPDTKSPS